MSSSIKKVLRSVLRQIFSKFYRIILYRNKKKPLIFTLVLSNKTSWIHSPLSVIFSLIIYLYFKTHGNNKVVFTALEHGAEALVVYLLPQAMLDRMNSLFKMSDYSSSNKKLLSIN